MVSNDAPEFSRLPVSVDLLHARTYVALVRLAAAFLGDRPSAEDVVQEVFARIQTRRPRLNDPDAMDRYLRVSVLNGARNALRDRKRSLVRDTAATIIDRRSSIVASAEVSVVARLDQQVVRTAVLALPDRQRDVVFLRYLADLSISETARTLNISEGAVKAANTRALKALAQVLGGTDDF